ncbi:hypothetical protein A3SI_17924 [Nitritalea halalkaliphila LW7]|uniref:Uncharacterized protein n=1 Tax=Nitritalea halalkaliphila LW7 TaxID=1189621 RepID=I5BV48_9BACT|nr:hypothetical protein [Nitritalea halalkaliphila]EIM73450.1 hypothetical protein A3SI_17924 [Nitritalea halalkaliphila LW7]
MELGFSIAILLLIYFLTSLSVLSKDSYRYRFFDRDVYRRKALLKSYFRIILFSLIASTVITAFMVFKFM